MKQVQKLKTIILSIWAPAIIFLIALFIAYQNYTPNTFLSGWDTLHPEFDFAINFKRLLSGVWRGEQGLGTVAGHAHMSDLPRVVFLWLAHFIVPLSSLRYLYVFVCLFLGPLGTYFLLRRLISSQPAAFVGGLFYLFNLSTVQQFYVLFEMFTTQYAFLPWLILMTISFLKGGQKKSLIVYSLLTLAASPQAYASHLWYAFFGVFVSFLVLRGFCSRDAKFIWKRIIILIILTITLNAYWLLPNLYFVKNHSQVPRQSKQNRIFSQEYLMRNRAHGTIADTAVLKGFYFNWQIYDFDKEKFVDLMPQWNYHIQKKSVVLTGYILFILAIFGIIVCLIYKDKMFIAFLPFFVIPMFFLLNRTYPFELFFDFLIHQAVLEETLRFVFTKFSILLTFGYSLYFAYFFQFLSCKINKRIFTFAFAIITVSGLIFFMRPIFQRSNLISPRVKIQIPKEYFALWRFMRDQPNGTVLSLPLYNFPGWQYYKWGYQGSGFIWFGMKQSVLDRDFDRWSVANEQAFREFHYALYAQQYKQFAKNLAKYNISYILWDKTVIAPYLKNRQQILYKKEITNLINQLIQEHRLAKLQEFGEIVVFKNLSADKEQTIKNITKTVSPPYRSAVSDGAYFQFGDYITYLDKKTNDYYYPFRTYFDFSDRLNNRLITVDLEDDSYALKNTAAPDFTKLVVPNYFKTERAFFADLYLRKKPSVAQFKLTLDPVIPTYLATSIQQDIQLTAFDHSVKFNLNSQSFTVPVDLFGSEPLYLGQALIFSQSINILNDKPLALSFKNGTQFSQRFTPELFFSKFPLSDEQYDSQKIYTLNQGQKNLVFDSRSQILRLTSQKNTQTGIYLDLSHLNHNLGYLLLITSRNLKGLPLRVCLKNIYSRICTFYDELTPSKQLTDDIFIIPPTDTNIGYELNIDNIGFDDYISQNELKKMALMAFPYHFLAQIYFEKNKLNQKANQTIIFHKAYEKNWKAYLVKSQKSKVKSLLSMSFPFIFGEEIKEHVLVNNWANGWRITGERQKFIKSIKSEIVIIFLPQYLEFLGFGIIIVVFVAITLRKI